MRSGAKDSANGEQEIERLIRSAHNGSAEALAQLIAEGRNYLLAVANREVPADLRAKVAPSDLVQESIIEAHRDFAGFAGQRRDELLAWLRRILLHNLANAKRKYHQTAKRDVAREVQLEGADSATGRAVDLPHPTPTPSSIAVRQEQAEQLEAAIQ
jgi:RNA polymerase sigma-70 factor, ECF subfamily